jgi:hypothetical protein
MKVIHPLFLIPAILLLASCARKEALNPTASSFAAHQTITTLNVRPAAIIDAGPAVPFIEYNICPFECCQYGKWVSESRLTAYRNEGDTGTTTFSINAKEEFTAIRGNVHILQTGMAKIKETTGVLQKNDTLYILSYKGEGYYDIWYHGNVYQNAYGFWQDDEKWLIREAVTEWWIYVKTKSGKYGWLRRNAKSKEHIEGADACG